MKLYKCLDIPSLRTSELIRVIPCGDHRVSQRDPLRVPLIQRGLIHPPGHKSTAQVGRGKAAPLLLKHTNDLNGLFGRSIFLYQLSHGGYPRDDTCCSVIFSPVFHSVKMTACQNNAILFSLDPSKNIPNGILIDLHLGLFHPLLHIAGSPAELLRIGSPPYSTIFSGMISEKIKPLGNGLSCSNILHNN